MSDEAIKCYNRFKENLRFAQTIESDYPDQARWSCVVRFYAALHLLSAYLIDKPNVLLPASTAHEIRKEAMRRCPELRDAPQQHRQLKDLSERVRYDAGFAYSPADHTRATKLLLPIIDIVEPKLKH